MGVKMICCLNFEGPRIVIITKANSGVKFWEGAAISLPSAGLTTWQMWKMPRASGLRGASRSRE